MPLLDIKNLKVDFSSGGSRALHAVDNLTLSLEKGDVLGIVGRSGSGKSVAMLAMMGLVPFPGQVSADALTFEGRDLLSLSGRERRAIIGKDIAMIFQEPATSLNPSFTIGFQIMETLRLHERMDRRSARRRAIELLEQVGIPGAEGRLKSYPHQMSGGMNQRVMIAMAIACNPKLLIADEPTTALDVTVQAPDSQSPLVAATRARHGLDIDHPQYGRGRRHRRSRRRYVCRTDRGATQHARFVCQPAASLYGGAACGTARGD